MPSTDARSIVALTMLLSIKSCSKDPRPIHYSVTLCAIFGYYFIIERGHVDIGNGIVSKIGTEISTGLFMLLG